MNQVARVMRMHVADEDAASKVDAIVAELEPKMKGQKGFVKVTRAVCKSEWEYEVEMVFELEAFQSYMVSFGHFMMWGPLLLAFLCLNIAGF